MSQMFNKTEVINEIKEEYLELQITKSNELNESLPEGSRMPVPEKVEDKISDIITLVTNKILDHIESKLPDLKDYFES